MNELKKYLDQVAPIPNQERITTPRDYSDIELTEEETAEALRKGREAKALQIRKEEYWQKITQELSYKKFNARELYHKLKHSRNAKGEYFTVDKENEEAVKLLCFYFSNDPRFEETEGFSLDKGLMLMGNVGIGKTHLMSFFFQNQNASYVMANCRRITDKWVNQDKNVIEYYSNPIPIALNTDPFGAQSIGVCFDDLGTESSPSKAYGEEKNVMHDILLNRYENRLPLRFTHITTNLSAHDIGLKYTTRVRDRLREMCNLIVFPNDAKSRRQ